MAAEMVWPDEINGEPDRSDAELVASARADPSAFALLYRRHVGAIHRFCIRRLGNREDAEDATSHVFAKAMVSLADYRGGSFKSWLFAIADRHTLDRLRARRGDVPLVEAGDLPDGNISPEAAVLVAEARGLLRTRLAGLTHDQRRVVELRLSGLTGDEIAQATGRSRNAVDALQFRAITRLRRLAKRDGTEGDDHEFA